MTLSETDFNMFLRCVDRTQFTNNRYTNFLKTVSNLYRVSDHSVNWNAIQMGSVTSSVWSDMDESQREKFKK